MNVFRNFLLGANSVERKAKHQEPIRRNNDKTDGTRNRRQALISRASKIAAALALTTSLATPLWADPFHFETGSPNGALGAASRRPGPGNVEIETADDFGVTETTVIREAKIFGLIPTGTSLADIQDVEVEVYHIFAVDSNVDRTSGSPLFSTATSPTRVNSPSDQEIETATRALTDGTLAISPTVVNASFTVNRTVVNGISVGAGSAGASTGQEVEITITFTTPIILSSGHYFFRPEVLLANGDFLYLSGQRPVVLPGNFTDLQAWIRNTTITPDWLRIGTDIIDGGPPAPTFNMAFSLTGETVPQAGTPGQPNCHGETISGLAHQFGDIDGAASSLGFSSVSALQNGFVVFCQ
jgi:hypothetical protein